MVCYKKRKIEFSLRMYELESTFFFHTVFLKCVGI